MKSEDMIRDVAKLKGLRLASIKPGAEITITEVHPESGSIEVQTSSGISKSRPFSELQRIWEAIQDTPAVHVDSILGGSGSSRNQPETILANLPYIEWLRIEGKKHIAFVCQPTHDYGSLKRMDSIDAEMLKTRLHQHGSSSLVPPSCVWITTDIAESCRQLEFESGNRPKAVIPGVYQINHGVNAVLIVLASVVPSSLLPGLYPVLPAANGKSAGITITIASNTYRIVRTTDGVFLSAILG